MRSLLMKNSLGIVLRGLAFSSILSVCSIASAAITGTYVPAEDGVNTFQSVDGVSRDVGLVGNSWSLASPPSRF